MAIFVYRVSDGDLFSWSPNDSDPVADAATLSANGLALIAGLSALDDSHTWDSNTKTVVAVIAPAVPLPIATGKWILRFTPQEFQAIAASTDATVQQFMYALNHTTEIDLTDADTINGVGYLVSINLLAASRVPTILGA